LGKTASSSWQKQQRDAVTQAQSLSHSLSQTSSLASSQLSQWSQQRGNSDTTVSGTDTSTSSNLTKALSTIQSIASRSARDENVSLTDAVREGATKSQDMSFGAGGSIQGSADTDRQILGKVAGLVTGAKMAGELHLKTDYSGHNGSSHGTSSDLTRQGGNSKGFSAQELKDFRDAMDVVASARVTDSGSHTDNASASLANQLSSTFSDLKNQASQYNDAVTRSHEYAQLASYAESNSANISQNYSQEFVGYVAHSRPDDADAILSDAASPEIRAERDKLAQEFVKDKIKPLLLQEFEQNQARASEGMGSVTSPSGDAELQTGYADQRAEMKLLAEKSGIKSDEEVKAKVGNQRSHAESRISGEKGTVNSSGNSTKTEYNRLQSEHEQGNQKFSNARKAEVERQNDKLGDNDLGKGALSKIKDDLKGRYNQN
jgi:conjugal transfer mating pair stabilization protein TraG